MPLKLVAWAYVSIAVSLAWAFCWRCLSRQHQALVARSALTWLAITAFSFLFSSLAFFFAASALTLFALTPKEPAERLAYFCAVVPAGPMAILWTIPFPGINYLYQLSYPGLASLVVLTPLALRRNGDSQPQDKGTAVFTIGLLYLALCTLLDFRETSVTNGLRHFFDHILSFGLLLLAFKKCAGNPNVIKVVPVGLLIAAAMLALIGGAQAYASWTFYDTMADELVFGLRAHITFIREGGMLRLPSTQDPIPFGVILGVSASLCYWSYHVGERKQPFTHLLLFAVVVICVLGTDSRGGFLALAVTLAALLTYSKGLRAGRRGLIFLAFAAGISGFLFFGLTDYLFSIDQYGTFEYRWRVMQVSAEAISYTPLFGSPTYHPIMETVRNNQNLIDIVNAYLEVPLRYGLVGLVLFATPGIIAVRSLMRTRARMESQGDAAGELTYRALAAFSISFLVAIGTVSLIGILNEYYWVIVGMAGASAVQLQAVPKPYSSTPLVNAR